MNVVIIVDHLRIGGAERIALDQSYCLADFGHNVTIIQFNGIANETNPSYLPKESTTISSKNIGILDFSGNHVSQIYKSLRYLLNNQVDLLIVHSLRGAAIFHLSRKIAFSNVKMTVTIHQIPELSAPLQRFKRFFYAQSADLLATCSLAMKQQWDEMTKLTLLRRLVFRKETVIIKNGVYLPRLNLERRNLVKMNSENASLNPRIISLGRNVHWKRLDILIQAAENFLPLNYDLLLMRPERNEELELMLKSKFGESVKFMYGETVSALTAIPGDVHIYPTDSGRHSQSSVNVLEMASLGIPTLVSEYGGDSWPELKSIGLIIEVNWQDWKSVMQNFESLDTRLRSFDLEYVHQLLDIRNNVEAHLARLDVS